MKSTIAKRSVIINGRKTSVSLENEFWLRLKEIARFQGVTTSKIVADVNKQRRLGNLSSAIRLFVLDRVSAQVPDTPVSTPFVDRVELHMFNGDGASDRK